MTGEEFWNRPTVAKAMVVFQCIAYGLKRLRKKG